MSIENKYPNINVLGYPVFDGGLELLRTNNKLIVNTINQHLQSWDLNSQAGIRNKSWNYMIVLMKFIIRLIEENVCC